MKNIAISIIGVGNVGASLARNLVARGFSVRVAGRDLERSRGLAAALGQSATAVPLSDVAEGARVVLLAVPADAAAAAVEAAGGLAGKIVVDCTNPLTWAAGPVHAPPPEGSMTAHLAARFPAARFVKAFNTFGAEIHERPEFGGTNADLYVAGDDAEAKGATIELGRAIGFEPIDVGPLRNARNLEAMAMLWIHLALVGGQGRQIAFKLVRR
jgi:8-hydroxy-5-deazaflavin:NADPH oxidoreductase